MKRVHASVPQFRAEQHTLMSDDPPPPSRATRQILAPETVPRKRAAN